jgi:hypothetical protein
MLRGDGAGKCKILEDGTAVLFKGLSKCGDCNGVQSAWQI